MAKKTFKQARAEILAFLKGAGWKVQERSSTGRPLKVPKAVSPAGDIALFFKPQAVWGHEKDSWRGKPDMKQARSLHIGDLRTMSGSDFEKRVFQWFSDEPPKRKEPAMKAKKLCPVSGYCYVFDGEVKSWERSSDGHWDIGMCDERMAKGAKAIGERLVDGSHVIVFKHGKKVFAQSAVNVRAGS